MIEGHAHSLRWAWACCIAIAVLTGVYLASTLDRVDYQTNADEGVYLRYAAEVARRGPSAFPDLFRTYIEDPRLHVFPNPLRVGYVAMAGLACRVFGSSFRTLSALSIASHLAFVLLTFGFAARHFGPLHALALAASLAWSPLLAGLARRALMDPFSTFVLSIAVWTFLEHALAPRDRTRAVRFAIAFFAALVTREVNILVTPAFIAFLLWRRFVRRGESAPVLSAIALAAPLVLHALVIVLASGSIAAAASTAWTVLGIPRIDYMARLGGGPSFRYVIDFVALSPWSTIAGLVGLGALVSGTALRGRAALEFFAIFLVALVLAFARWGKNVRLVAILELPLRALAVALLFDVLLRGRTWRAPALGLCLVALTCVADARTLRTFFVEADLYDPMSVRLLILRGLVPWPPWDASMLPSRRPRGGDL